MWAYVAQGRSPLYSTYRPVEQDQVKQCVVGGGMMGEKLGIVEDVGGTGENNWM